MIKNFVEAFVNNGHLIQAKYMKAHPENYAEVVKNVVEIMPEVDYEKPDPARIHEIDDGDYQGTLLYIIAAEGYQPSQYWYVTVSYGSCSGCDTLEGIKGYGDGPPSEQQVKDYMTLSLHIVQGIKLMEGGLT